MAALFFANVAVYLVKTVCGDWGDAWVTEHLSHQRNLVLDGEVWRIVTSIFVHPVFIHLAFNMLVHVQVGGVMERILGHGRYALLYFASGLGGALAFQAFGDPGAGMGASGAIYGVAGAYITVATARDASGEIRLSRRFIVMALILLLGDQIFAFIWERGAGVMRIAVSAHAGGLVTGCLLGYAMTPRPAEIAVAGRNKRRLAALTAASGLLGLGIWTFVISPRHDDLAPGRRPIAMARQLRGQEEVRQTLERGKGEEAVRAWKELEIESPEAHREAGYAILYEGLLLHDEKALATEVLDRLIESAESSLRAGIARSKATGIPEVQPHHLNELAWYLALRGSRLDEALGLVDQALAAVDREEEGIWRFLPRSREALLEKSTFINTRGWIRLQMGEASRALADLELAAQLAPFGPNLLYLGIAQNLLGNTKAARDTAERAGKSGHLTPYESKLLRELKDSLGVE